MLIAALFIIARTWKQHRYTSIDEWIKQLWYIYTMEYYSVMKRNVFESVLMKWMNLEPITEWSKSERKTPIQYINAYLWNLWASLVAQRVKRLPAVQETCVCSLGWEDLLEKEMATHSSTLAWRIPRTEGPGGLQSMGLQTVRHDWATSLSLLLFMEFRKMVTMTLYVRKQKWHRYIEQSVGPCGRGRGWDD